MAYYIRLSPFEVWLKTNKLHLVKWEYDACEASESIMKAPEYLFVKDKKINFKYR